MAIQFHETVMGHRFFEQQLPQLIKAVERLAAAMEYANSAKPADTTQVIGRPNTQEESTYAVLAEVTKALMSYSAENVDVVLNEETGMLDVIWHSEGNSFPIRSGVAALDAVDKLVLTSALNKMNVGVCF